ncbi:MAG: hypothetical protein ACPLYD_00115 [Anaerolineae bacterium]
MESERSGMMRTVELELLELRTRVARLEERLDRLTAAVPEAPPVPEDPTDSQQVLAWLKARGIVRDPTPEELRLAAEWDALSEEEKEAHIRFMRTLVLDPPLSQIIIDNRR